MSHVTYFGGRRSQRRRAGRPVAGRSHHGACYGVASTAGALGTMNVYRSDGSSQTIGPLAAGASTRVLGSADRQGNGTAVRATGMTQESGAIQQADSDGGESTTFLPTALLDSQYYLPSNSQYVAFSCPTSMTIYVGAAAVPCNSPAVGHPGHGHKSGGGLGAGTEIRRRPASRSSPTTKMQQRTTGPICSA